jgi:hypothetical protein
VDFFPRTYTNRKRVEGPSTTLAFGIAFTQSTVALVAVKPHHSSLLKRRDEAVGESGS